MRYQTAIEVFGNNGVIAKALSISEAAVRKWKKVGVVPFKRAGRLQRISRGRAKVDASLYDADGNILVGADGRALVPGGPGRESRARA